MSQFNISEDSLYSLLGEVVENIKKQEHLDSQNKWISRKDDYLTGFNDGYLIKKYRPNVSMKFEGLHPARTEYYRGLKDGLMNAPLKTTSFYS